VAKNQNNKSVSEPPSLHGVLKAKSGQRRGEEFAALVTSSPAPRVIRNDLLPKLALMDCPPADLVAPARNVRKIKGGPPTRGRQRYQPFGVFRPGFD